MKTNAQQFHQEANHLPSLSEYVVTEITNAQAIFAELMASRANHPSESMTDGERMLFKAYTSATLAQ